MSKQKNKKIYTLVAFDEKGLEVARFEGITEDEAWAKKRDYVRVSVFESDVVSPRVRCDIPDCGRIAVARIKLGRDDPILNVCRYHGAGVFVTFKGIPVMERVRYKGVVIAPSWLCVKYCPSYWEGECRGFERPITVKERRKREKGYTVYGENMTVLCVEDDWWKLLAGVGGEKLLESLYI